MRATERKVSLRRSIRGDRYRHRFLFASGAAFSPCSHSVSAWRNARDLVRTVCTTNGKQRVSHHADIRFHPGVLIALNRDEHFRSSEGLFNWALTDGLGLVPFRIQPRSWVDVVRRLVAVGDADLLIDHNAHHVRAVVATFLIELGRGAWRVPGILGNLLPGLDSAFFYVNEGIGDNLFDDEIDVLVITAQRGALLLTVARRAIRRVACPEYDSRSGGR